MDLARINLSHIDHSGALSRGPHYTPGTASMRRCGASNEEHAVAAGSVESARLLGAPAMIVITLTGFAPQLVSSYRPAVPVFAVCTDETVFRQLRTVWGVKPVLADVEEVTYDNLCEFGKRAVIDAGIGRQGDSVVVTSGYPFHTAHMTNTMRVEPL
jgi:pyruvate kinase